MAGRRFRVASAEVSHRPEFVICPCTSEATKFRNRHDCKFSRCASVHLFPPYTDAKNEELKQWLDY
jgi:hypothetical protein